MSDFDQHDDIHDLLVQAPAPEMQFHLDDAVRLGKRVRLRRRIAAAGGGLAAAAAVALTVTLALPGEPAPTLQPAAPTPSATSTTESTALVDTQCFPMDTSVKSTPWIDITVPNSLPKGGPVIVKAGILSGCPNNIRQDVDGPEGKGDFTLDVKFAQKPTTAQWSVGMRSTVFILPKGQRPCGYSNGKTLPVGVTVHNGDWDIAVQPVSDALARNFDGKTTVNICDGDKVVATNLPQILGQNSDAEGEFNHRLLRETCDLHQLEMFEDSAVQWARKTVPNSVGGRDLTVDIDSHPGAGCTGYGSTTGPLDANDDSKGLLLEMDFPEAPTHAFWDIVQSNEGDDFGAFIVPPGQNVCDIDTGTPGSSLPKATDVPLDNGWSLHLQPFPKVGKVDDMGADICTAGTKVLTVRPLMAR